MEFITLAPKVNAATIQIRLLLIAHRMMFTHIDDLCLAVCNHNHVKPCLFITVTIACQCL